MSGEREMEELLKQCRDALKECSDDLAALVEEEYGPTKDSWPSQSRRYERDIAPVNAARVLLPKLDAALAQPQLRDAPEGWMPIETIPMGSADDPGQEVLVWVPRGGIREQGKVAFAYAYRSHDGTPIVKASGYVGDWEFTHWMPSPSGPKDKSR